MIRCFRTECQDKVTYECIKEDLVIYSCDLHAIGETKLVGTLVTDIESLRSIVSKKQKLLVIATKVLEKLKKYFKTIVSIAPKHPSNQFIMTGLVGLRQVAGQKQNRNMVHILKLGIKALQKYPLPIMHPDQILDLQGIGPSQLKSLHDLFRTNGIRYKNLKNSFKPLQSEPISSDIIIKLYIDLRETRSNELTTQIEASNIPYSTKTLSLGDYLFVAEGNNKIYTLDVIIERKSSSDLNSSHFSNHLRDQIRRLKACSVPIKVLLIEGKVNYKILTEMWIEHNIRIVALSSQKKTISLLKVLHDYLRHKYKDLSSFSGQEDFESFQKKHGNHNTVGEIFYRQLLEFPGMSVKKLTHFIGLYPTISDFLRSYNESSSLVHQNLQWCGIKNSLETSIYEFFGIK